MVKTNAEHVYDANFHFVNCNACSHLTHSQLPVLSDYYKVPRVLVTELEPTFIGLGLKYLAIGMNNRAWFFELKDSGKLQSLLIDRLIFRPTMN